jgi:hypothetical protein
MDGLPYIDEHSARSDASTDAVWSALLDVLGRETPGNRRLARMLRCDPAAGTPAFSGRPGEAVPGFRVAQAEPNRLLVLRGRHRFADYALTLILGDGRLRARTHAVFPGLLGRLYRAAVIGTGAHGVFTRRLLRRVVRCAEAAGEQPGPPCTTGPHIRSSITRKPPAGSGPGRGRPR